MSGLSLMERDSLTIEIMGTCDEIVLKKKMKSVRHLFKSRKQMKSNQPSRWGDERKKRKKKKKKKRVKVWDILFVNKLENQIKE